MSETNTKIQPNPSADADATKRHKPAPLGRQDNAPAAKITQPPKPAASVSKLPAPPPLPGAKTAAPASAPSKATPAASPSKSSPISSPSKPTPTPSAAKAAPKPSEEDAEGIFSTKPDGAPPQPTEIRSLASLAGSYELKQGLELGEYSLIEPIAQGAMGEVWKARNSKIGKWAAIKVPSHEIASRKDAAERFLQEARAVNEIRHRNIVDIFDFGTLLDGRPYYVMELLDGQPLSGYLKSNGPLTFQEIIDIFGQVCQALQAAHDNKIIHRDLKSDNIFLIIEKKGPPFVKVLDFGIAKLHGIQHNQQEATLPGAVYGTPAYMSPEQCQGAEKVSYLADIYSLGVILYEMITGRRPFIEASGNTGMLLVKHITSKPLPPSKMVRGRSVPLEIDALLMRALAKDLKDRPQSCDAFQEELLKATGCSALKRRMPSPRRPPY